MEKEFIDKERIEKIRDYYKKCQLWLPDKSQWRSWKFKLTDGTYKRFHIKNEKELRKLLVKYTPIRVYYSQVAILNIRNCKGRTTKEKEVRIFKDSIIDIDNEDFEKCRQSAIEIIYRIGEPDYILKTYKGIHLCYFKKEINPELIKDIKDFDIATLKNDYNEFSCPGTLNKGKVCTILTLYQLISRDFTQEAIYNYSPLNVEETSKIPAMENEQVLNEHPRGNLSERMRSKINSTGTEIEGTVQCFTNQVKPGIFIPILIYEKKTKDLCKEITYLINQYDLSELVVFENESFVCVISLKCFQKRQLQKLLNSSSSLTKLQFNKFNKIWFNISEFKLKGILRYRNDRFLRVSKKHKEFFEALRINFNCADELVGKTPLEIYEMKTR